VLFFLGKSACFTEALTLALFLSIILTGGFFVSTSVIGLSSALSATLFISFGLVRLSFLLLFIFS